MAITRPVYATREQVMRAPDFKDSMVDVPRIDRALMSTADVIEGRFHRVFYPRDTTFAWDWPNFQYAYPWRVWFDQWDLISLTSLESPPGTTIPNADVILRPFNRKPGWPYTYLELDRSTTAAFGAASTPQLSIRVTGTWGFTNDADAAGTLAAAITDTTGTSVTVSDGSAVGIGNLIAVDSERMLVHDKSLASTGQTQQSGCSTASSADNVLTVTDGTKYAVGETIVLGSERMLITQIVGNLLTVKRAWDGTILAVHGGATIYAPRLLTVARGQLGTTAATHSNAAAVNRHRPPSAVQDLQIGLAVNKVLQETGGYAAQEGTGQAARPLPGVALADLWADADQYRRKNRSRAI